MITGSCPVTGMSDFLQGGFLLRIELGDFLFKLFTDVFGPPKKV